MGIFLNLEPKRPLGHFASKSMRYIRVDLRIQGSSEYVHPTCHTDTFSMLELENGNYLFFLAINSRLFESHQRRCKSGVGI